MSWHKSLQIWRIRLKKENSKCASTVETSRRTLNRMWWKIGTMVPFCSLPGCCRPLQGATVMQIYFQPWIYSFVHSRPSANSPLWHILHLLQEVRSDDTKSDHIYPEMLETDLSLLTWSQVGFFVLPSQSPQIPFLVSAGWNLKMSLKSLNTRKAAPFKEAEVWLCERVLHMICAQNRVKCSHPILSFHILFNSGFLVNVMLLLFLSLPEFYQYNWS